MSTCGLYNQTGTHMVRTGLPAKSGVSGYILASALGQAGIAVISPRVNAKGTSIRGAIMLEHLSKAMDGTLLANRNSRFSGNLRGNQRLVII